MGEGESKTPIPRSSSVGKRLRSLVRKQKSSQEKETGNLKSVIDQYRLRDATSRKDSVSALEFGRAVDSRPIRWIRIPLLESALTALAKPGEFPLHFVCSLS